MTLDKDYAVFSTGKRRYAYGAVLGLRDGRITYGYDGTFWPTQEEREADAEDEDRAEWLTREEIIEVGAFMVAQWTSFLKNAETDNL